VNTRAARTVATLPIAAAMLCAQQAHRPPATSYQAPDAQTILGPAPADLRPLLERYSSDLQSLRMFYDVSDSPTTERVMRQFYEAWRTGLHQVRFDSLPQEGRIDYLLFSNKLDHDIRQLDLNRKRAGEIGVASIRAGHRGAEGGAPAGGSTRPIRGGRFAGADFQADGGALQAH
jgi:hypothetical protein